MGILSNFLKRRRIRKQIDRDFRHKGIDMNYASKGDANDRARYWRRKGYSVSVKEVKLSNGRKAYHVSGKWKKR